VISFESVTKTFPDGTTAVHDLTLSAADGEITVLVGPSGCGKTTSLRMVNRMIDPTLGRVTLDGRDVSDLPLVELRRGIGYVIQQGGLFPHQTVSDNIATVPRLLGWDRRRCRLRSAELMERVGLDPALADRYPAQLSGGQQQRVGVARALAADPPVMLMDEPFSAVDPLVRSDLQDEFLRIQADLSKTIILVTHDIDEAIKLGDRIAVLAVGGRLAQMNSPAELLAAPEAGFVEGFVGRDRGIRGLSFLSAANLPVGPPVTVRDSRRLTFGRLTADLDGERWVLVVDDASRPLGWLDTSSLHGEVTISELPLHRIVDTFTVSSSVRSVLNATLSSPSGQAVRVDDQHRVDGVVNSMEVATYLARRGTQRVAP
jgi:osmoprotectant transport system ATP-binding protein